MGRWHRRSLVRHSISRFEQSLGVLNLLSPVASTGPGRSSGRGYESSLRRRHQRSGQYSHFSEMPPTIDSLVIVGISVVVMG